MVSAFSDSLAESKIAALDLASNYDELSGFARQKLQDEFKSLGLELTKFVVENISLPEEVEAAMDKRTSMGVIGDVGRYAQFQAADAMRDAAQNPSGGAGLGVQGQGGLGQGERSAGPGPDGGGGPFRRARIQYAGARQYPARGERVKRVIEDRAPPRIAGL